MEGFIPIYMLINKRSSSACPFIGRATVGYQFMNSCRLNAVSTKGLVLFHQSPSLWSGLWITNIKAPEIGRFLRGFWIYKMFTPVRNANSLQSLRIRSDWEPKSPPWESDLQHGYMKYQAHVWLSENAREKCCIKIWFLPNNSHTDRSFLSIVSKCGDKSVALFTKKRFQKHF